MPTIIYDCEYTNEFYPKAMKWWLEHREMDGPILVFVPASTPYFIHNGPYFYYQCFS